MSSTFRTTTAIAQTCRLPSHRSTNTHKIFLNLFFQ